LPDFPHRQAIQANSEDQHNLILMHALGANTANQPGGVIAGGILLAILSNLIWFRRMVKKYGLQGCKFEYN